jgi:hypothetical protein
MNEKNDEDRGFLKGIKPSTFLSTHQEWHAFVNGFCEVLCPFPPRFRLRAPSPVQDATGDKLFQEIKDEYHYYVFGRVIGVIAWLIIAAVIKAMLF